MRKRLFSLLTFLATRHPGKTLIAVALLTGVMILFTGQLKIQMAWLDMVPKNERVSKTYKKIIKDFEGAVNMIIIAVEGSERDGIIKVGKEVE